MPSSFEAQGRRILIVGSYPSSLVNFRGALLSTLSEKGFDVDAAAPGLLENPKLCAQLACWKVTPHNIYLDRTGKNPFTDAVCFIKLLFQIRRLNPDILIAYTIKPVIYGLLAASLAGVGRRFALITGLGYAFGDTSTNGGVLLKGLAGSLYKLSLKTAQHVFFQNPDDKAFFQESKILSSTTPSTIVNGSGVDLEYYSSQPLPRGGINFLLVARLLIDKGVCEYAASAKIIRDKYPNVKFRLVGYLDSNPSSIKPEELAEWVSEDAIEYLGEQDDVRPAMSDCSVFVLPSYREGMPRTVLEAMAVGRAIITTDTPGCRETVSEGENGFLVPVKSVDALVQAMERFVKNPNLVESMGARSLELAIAKYDVHKVNSQMLDAMGLL
jgi:glycosyltransferase involved in cell wall biosynthesis